ncbi:hypothetical protein FHR81_004114 [Actinoalloteichus hoggarensis]|uniref:Uncharacterized protein n=1 Tax=Actinoalloteichus hoggarensis TaxID=1470176 RepID=A0A221WAK4_9PSEU|nr:hypothetical protein AHOG_24620 [Actinoalloteichus hoggarensis]MBB5923047.1 hypothetical protein [Actinoalloteichus hoggarensis]
MERSGLCANRFATGRQDRAPASSSIELCAAAGVDTRVVAPRTKKRVSAEVDILDILTECTTLLLVGVHGELMFVFSGSLAENDRCHRVTLLWSER